MKINAYGKFIALNTYIRNFTKRLAVSVPRSQREKSVRSSFSDIGQLAVKECSL